MNENKIIIELANKYIGLFESIYKEVTIDDYDDYIFVIKMYNMFSSEKYSPMPEIIEYFEK